VPMIGNHLGADLNLVGQLIGGPTAALIKFVLWITGQGD
jgi:hypothetical protein